MDFFLGIDLGTSSVNVTAVSDSGTVLAASDKAYPLLHPHAGYAEQEPEAWWDAAVGCIRAVVSSPGIQPTAIKSVGFSGQMHGLVLVDHRGVVLRPAIVWPDTRTAAICAEWTAAGLERDFRFVTGLPLATGYLAPSLEWVKRNEPDAYRRAFKIMLPKDYIRFRLTGMIKTDPSDAAGSYLYDVRQRQWSSAVVGALRIDDRLLPDVVDTFAVAGCVTPMAARETGLIPGTPVAAGGSDQAMAALALGLDRPGKVAVAISTGATILTPVSVPVFDPRMHTLCHARSDAWLIMGAVLSGGAALAWFRDKVLFSEEQGPTGEANLAYDFLMEKAEAVPPGADGLFFLPYLSGERTPHMDPNAKGGFIGLGLHHTRHHLTRAILEGVAYAMRESMDIYEELGLPIDDVVCYGGGAQNGVWRQIIADVFGRAVRWRRFSDFASLGAAMCGAQAIGVPIEAVDRDGSDEVSHPAPANVAYYEKKRRTFRDLYRQLKPTFAWLS